MTLAERMPVNSEQLAESIEEQIDTFWSAHAPHCDHGIEVEVTNEGTVTLMRRTLEENGTGLKKLRIGTVAGWDDELRDYLLLALRQKARQKAIDAHPKSGNGFFPWTHSVHSLAKSWLESEGIDLAHAFQHDGSNLSEEFEAEVGHTRGNWGRIKTGRFTVEDGLVTCETISNPDQSMMLMGMMGSRKIRLVITATVPLSFVHRAVGMPLGDVVDIAVFRRQSNLKILNAGSQLRGKTETLLLDIEPDEALLAPAPEDFDASWKDLHLGAAR